MTALLPLPRNASQSTSGPVSSVSAAKSDTMNTPEPAARGGFHAALTAARGPVPGGAGRSIAAGSATGGSSIHPQTTAPLRQARAARADHSLPDGGKELPFAGKGREALAAPAQTALAQTDLAQTALAKTGPAQTDTTQAVPPADASVASSGDTAHSPSQAPSDAQPATQPDTQPDSPGLTNLALAGASALAAVVPLVSAPVAPALSARARGGALPSDAMRAGTPYPATQPGIRTGSTRGPDSVGAKTVDPDSAGNLSSPPAQHPDAAPRPNMDATPKSPMVAAATPPAILPIAAQGAIPTPNPDDLNPAGLPHGALTLAAAAAPAPVGPAINLRPVVTLRPQPPPALRADASPRRSMPLPIPPPSLIHDTAPPPQALPPG